MKTLRETTEEWLKNNEWSGDESLTLAVAQLRVLADGIDNDPAKASLHSQFGLTLRFIMSFAPKEQEMEDPLEMLLRGQDA